MLEIKNVEVFCLDRALLASGNPMTVGPINTTERSFTTGEAVRRRGVQLASAKQGSGHDNFLSGILVQFDIKYPLYWSPEFQRYHFAQIISSQSTMHRLTTAGNYDNFESMFNKYVDDQIINIVGRYIEDYNRLQEFKLSEEDSLYWRPDSNNRFTKEEFDTEVYKAFMRVRSNLPSGYEMWMTVSTNYLQLKTIYNQRKGHKLREDWGAFIKMCDELPLFKDMIFSKS